MLLSTKRSSVDVRARTGASLHSAKDFVEVFSVHAGCVRTPLGMSVWWCMQAVERASALVGKANPIHHDEIW